ncbi:hypothetical protein BC835DRAFT_1358498 [Cytidiella melzeri]|nr:hypothetical protein BC835DRAFT_1358498 [Cytidiella melzeri]
MKMSTSSAPKVPNSTPISARPALRAPIHNPYDKFSQPEFDAWIGDLTSVLKRALGHEPPSPQPAKPKPSASFADISVAFDEDVAEDSFAEIKARRAAKGKQRAVRDEDEEEFEVETSIVGEHIAEEEDILQDLGYSPHRYDSQPEEGSEDEEAAPVLFNNADEPIEILSSDEDEGEYDDDQVDAANVDSGRFVEDGREYEDIEDEGDGILRHMQGEEDELDDELNAEEEEDGPDSPPAELSNARYSTRRSAEDDDDDNSEMPYNARSRAGKVDETEDEEDIEEIEDEEFAPTHPVRQLPAVELLDKWEGPRVYAEDFYAGGDQPQKYMSTHTPSHLTPPPGSPKGLDDLGHTSDAPTSVGKSNCVIGSPEVTEVDDEDEDGEEIYEAPPTFSMPTEEEVRAMSRSGLFDELQNGATVSVDADEPVDFTSDLQQSIAGRAQSDELVSPAVHTPERPPSARQFVPHDRSLSPIRVSPRGHLDWNNPPAFPTGIPISPSKSPRPRYNNVLLMDDVVEITDEYDEDDRGEEAQDDDEQDDDFVGPAPLGTSDLDIFTNHDEVLPDAQELLSSPVAHLPESVIEDFDVFSADGECNTVSRRFVV